jgi:hypothetical protein
MEPTVEALDSTETCQYGQQTSKSISVVPAKNRFLEGLSIVNFEAAPVWLPGSNMLQSICGHLAENKVQLRGKVPP